MTKSEHHSAFPTLLASTVHDIKNSLGTLLALVEQLEQTGASNLTDDCRHLRFEATRINHSLMQLLVLHKIDTRKFALAIDQYPALDLINEAKAQQDRLAWLNRLDVRVQCTGDLVCYCDYQIVSNALGTVLNNAQRYSRRCILMSASQQDAYLRFCIEDDGEGYPPHLLAADLGSQDRFDWATGNSGLGLYFVAAVASLHKNQGRSGFVQIDNDSALGGARSC
ncbi:MAG: HAMP domain-containing histidine kinase [Methylomonas sp.]|nr:HAMP domain-containing histidine kinase [Methylomonas sp.]